MRGRENKKSSRRKAWTSHSLTHTAAERPEEERERESNEGRQRWSKRRRSTIVGGRALHSNGNHLSLFSMIGSPTTTSFGLPSLAVVKPRAAAAEHISQFNEEARSPFVKKFKTIIHPGEVNRIRELPQNSRIVATHTDSPDVLIWDVESQPNRHAVLGASESHPDLILTGHQDNAEFALAMCPTEPFVLSGGKDKSVVL
ncbi:hypothetical protein ACH5RR_024404 [Cinchona calisaya]|uniref:Uncharacterized protein n=1 Tax=Cinchona calisaya TaxID=153742 RepID=A0ABD2YZR7_9GENT